jgi:hypothetical protein
MARPLRIEFAGALYHITARGNERREIEIVRWPRLIAVARTACGRSANSSALVA